MLRPRRRFIELIALVLAVFALVAACGADDATSSTSRDGQASSDDGAPATSAPDDSDVATGDSDGSDEAFGEAEEPADRSAAPTGDGELGSGGFTGGSLTPADLGRQIIFTAEISVEVDDVAAAGRQAREVIEDVGGFVFGQNTEGGDNARSEITFKVLPERFDDALARLGEIGELRNQTVSTDDVTERVVDLESRIQVAELGVDRLRAALENATDLADFAEIERLLLNRESELEVMRGQLRTLEVRVDLATITLTLTQDVVRNAIDLAITAYEGHDGGVSCPGEPEARAEANTDVTLCFEVVNNGDQTLTDVVLTDTVLEIGVDDQSKLIAVFDSLDELAPRQSALVAFEVTPERTIRPRPRVSAVPTDGVSPDPVGPAVSSTVGFELRTFEPETDPGFGDGFDAASSVLAAIFIAATVAVGFLIPMLAFVPFLVLLWAAFRWWRPRAEERRLRRLEERDRRLDSQRPAPPPPRADV